jgi:hypothetical protein
VALTGQDAARTARTVLRVQEPSSNV